MPNKISPELLRGSFKKGHLEFSNGGVLINPSAPSRLVDLLAKDQAVGSKDGRVFVKAPLYLEDHAAGTDNAAMLHAIRTIKAQDEITRAWRRAGGTASRVGMPLGRAISVTETSPNIWAANFRSGQIEMHVMNDNNAEIKQIVNELVRVRLVGIECQMRQEEGENKLYGTLGILTPSDNRFESRSLPPNSPYWSMGDGIKLGRLETLDIPIVWNWPIKDIWLSLALVESDQDANVDKIKKKTAENLGKLGRDKLRDLTGLDAEDVLSAEDQDKLIEDIADWVLDELFGAGDDPFSIGVLKISAQEIMDGPIGRPPFKRGDDSNIITEWTHELVVWGIDDGDDKGQYRLFFDVAKVPVHEVTTI